MEPSRLQFSYETRLLDLGLQLRTLLNKAFPILAALLIGVSGYLFVGNRPGAITFALLSAGILIGFNIWRTAGIGLPMLPMMCAQHLVAYGLPILVRHPVVQAYPPETSLRAGIELLAFLATMSFGWRFGLNSARTSRPTARLLNIMVEEGMAGLRRLGFTMLGIGTAYQVLSVMGLLSVILSLLPAGTFPIVLAVVSAVTSCGLFLLSVLLSSDILTRPQKSTFWILLVVNTLISASGFLLSAVGILLFSVAVGLFWGSGRMPWRFIIAVGCTLAFLNLGKFEMRGLYWQQKDETVEATTLLNMPERYLQWAQASWTIMTATEEDTNLLWQAQYAQKEDASGSGQSLLMRVNNLQNILYVIDRFDSDHVEPLHGKTYTLIPALLVPRILWPGKPRSHEGQVLLNVHFGRQLLDSTFVTYIAWGLLAEAYGNFGPLVGSICVGFVIGWLFGLLEKKSSAKPLLSLEGFLAFIVFVSVANSFEMVASVLVTSTFQAIVPVATVGAFFTRRFTLNTP
jgi:hypothetical protein